MKRIISLLLTLVLVLGALAGCKRAEKDGVFEENVWKLTFKIGKRSKSL